MFTEVAFVDVHERCEEASSPLIVVGLAVNVTVGFAGGPCCWSCSLLFCDLPLALPQAVIKSERVRTATKQTKDCERDTRNPAAENRYLRLEAATQARVVAGCLELDPFRHINLRLTMAAHAPTMQPATSSKTLTIEGSSARSLKAKIPRTEVHRRRSGRPRQALLPHRRGLPPVQASGIRAAFLGDRVSSAEADEGQHRATHVPPP